MIIVDTSLWIEFFAGTKLDLSVLNAIRNKNELCIPVVCLYEIRKKFLNDNDVAKADLSVDILKSGRIIDMDSEIAILASDISKQHKLPMADSLIYATAQIHGAELYTQDKHFDGLANVHYFARPY